MPDVESYRFQAANTWDYIDYLTSIEEEWPEYTDFRAYLEDNFEGHSCRKSSLTGHVHFHNVLPDNSFCTPFSFKAQQNSDIEGLKNALSNPTPGSRTRLVLVGLDNQKTIDQRVLNLLRLSFNIDPLFFWSLLGTDKFVSRQQESLSMSYMAIKILRNCPTISGHVSVAIIALDEGKLPWATGVCSYNMDLFLFDIHKKPSVTDREYLRSHFKYNPKSERRIDLFQNFSGLVRAYQNISSEDDLFRCLSLMAMIHLATFCQVVGDYSYPEPNELDVFQWQRFRDELDRFQDDVRTFSRFARREFDDLRFREQLEEIREDQDDLLTKAQAVETLLRDTLQVSVGLKSLEESRRSIEEGKNTKLITILAFVFIPTSLASSVFGMNVQEINNTGKSIWVFIVTAVAITVIALATWCSSNLARAVWHSRDSHKANFSRMDRLSSALWLISNPTTWGNMPQGTLLGLLTNSRFGLREASYRINAAQDKAARFRADSFSL